MGLKVQLHRRAAHDLQDIHDHLVQQSGAPAAECVRAELRRNMQRLAARPFLLGRSTWDAEIRILT